MTVSAPAYLASQHATRRLEDPDHLSYVQQYPYQVLPLDAGVSDGQHAASYSWSPMPFFPSEHMSCQVYDSGYNLPRSDSGFGIPTPCYLEEPAVCTVFPCDERHDTPWSGPEPESMSPASYRGDSVPYMDHPSTGASGHARTISMTDVQQHADISCDMSACGEYGVLIPEGYSSMPSTVAETPPPVTYHQNVYVDGPPTPVSIINETPIIRHRRTHRPSTTSAPRASRISKRSVPRRASALSSKSHHTSDSEEDSAGKRLFSCPLAPYGCDSTFGSKNEWKRHFSTQHLRLGFWRCDQCPCHNGRKPNDFNRKDLFVQHVRRMHCPKPTASTRKKQSRSAKHDDVEGIVTTAADRCHKKVRTPPLKSMCVVCGQRFFGLGSWDERMEHIGRHFEEAKKDGSQSYNCLDVASWKTDTDAEEWMIGQRILKETVDKGVIIAEEQHD